MPVRIAKQAIYCSNYIIHDVVQLYQTTVPLPGCFLKYATSFVSLQGKGEEKGASLAQFALYTYLPTMGLYDLL